MPTEDLILSLRVASIIFFHPPIPPRRDAAFTKRPQEGGVRGRTAR
jgi:hypothetical protein